MHKTIKVSLIIFGAISLVGITIICVWTGVFMPNVFGTCTIKKYSIASSSGCRAHGKFQQCYCVELLIDWKIDIINSSYMNFWVWGFYPNGHRCWTTDSYAKIKSYLDANYPKGSNIECYQTSVPYGSFHFRPNISYVNFFKYGAWIGLGIVCFGLVLFIGIGLYKQYCSVSKYDLMINNDSL